MKIKTKRKKNRFLSMYFKRRILLLKQRVRSEIRFGLFFYEKTFFCFKYICKLASRAAKDASDTRQEQKIIGAEQRNAFIEACGTAFFEDFADKLRAEIISSAAVLYSEATGDAAEQAVSEKRMAFHHAPYSHTRSL